MANPVIVFDNGSAIFKADHSTESEPSIVFPTIVSRRRYGGETGEGPSKDFDIPIDISKRTDKNNILNYPIENGIVTNWEYMEKIWQYTFEDQLKVKSEEHAILLTEAPHNPKSNREKMAEVMFENFSAPRLLVMTQGVLSSFGAGQLSGIVLEIGHGVTQIVPLMEGYTIKNSIIRSDLAGNDLTEYLMKMLSNNNKTCFTTRSEKEFIQDIKEKHCFVYEDYEKELKLDNKKVIYTLPDGRVINIGNEKFQCPDLLFDPMVFDINSKGVQELVNHSIQSCAMDMRKALYSNVILSGGTAMLPGFDKRLEKELKELSPDGTKIKVKEVKNKYLAWIGGATLANHSTFQKISITKQQYEEHGSSILHKIEN